ncbi:HK97 family phage prohead protease [Myroides odoratimimus]|uniref:HK97 family phage prohead protease n=1 Tax=Myroides odoratimimus TaxID=76832 RepID=UPI002578A940|nr:HK97 family phage prohead protease [Myroides odoratimimus]MDM1033817.1 HK97 family phage prohead protease [Myroides odoratimimus]
MSEKKRFVASDQSIKNSLGFYVLTSGIDLKRFNDNPIMLNGHRVDNSSVLGKWLDVAVEGELLLMTPEFDEGDDEALVIKGKVDRGYIKGCSIGFIYNPEDFEWVGDKLILTKCELYEVSIVAVPSNRNAIQLYNQNLELQSEDAIKACLSLIPNELNIEDKMNKVQLSVAVLTALGMTEAPKDGVDVAVIEAKVLGLSNQVAALSAENAGYKSAQEANALAEKTAYLDKAVTDGKITTEQKPTFEKLELSIAKSIIEELPSKQSLSHQISNAGAGKSEVKTMDDFQKLDLTAQLAFKQEQPEAYKKLFTVNG